MWLVFYSILFNLCGSPDFYLRNQNVIKRVGLFTSTFPSEKCASFSHCFIQKWEEIESLKNEKNPGIVLEKSWNSVYPFPYEEIESLKNEKKSWNSPGKVLEFCFSISVNPVSGITSECQTVWIQIRSNILSGLIWVQTVCKVYQQTTQVGNDFIVVYFQLATSETWFEIASVLHQFFFAEKLDPKAQPHFNTLKSLLETDIRFSEK